MHGDFSRWTFDPADGYRSVLLQQGRVLLDADWNEQTEITARHDEVRTRDVFGPAGGPLDGAGFAVVDAAGVPASGVAWADLRITPGRWYVDGVLAEAARPAGGGAGHPLADQPFLRKVGNLPGLAEPAADGRYALVLDVWAHHVSADEAPDLLESALGGPDTTTRLRTVWQVRTVPVAAAATCADVTDPVWQGRTPPTMTASLREVDLTADPCRISTSGGYRRLENQLYRVQIHDVAADGTARYLYSRENGSVVAGLLGIAAPSAAAAAAGMDAQLRLDRVGRDEELSFREGDVVEVTSVDRQLHRLSGYLATAGAPDELTLPVQWLDTAPASRAALGGTPVVRRWEAPPATANAGADELDRAGIEIRFGAGDFRVGDHWLIPARTVRLVYGVTALSGTIEWPADDLGVALPRPPVGPVHHVTTLCLLDRATVAAAGSWTVAADCRGLAPPLTALTTIDLLGGDGQSAAPGAPLPEPVRVVVRNGGLPVAGARVRFRAAGGHLSTAVPTGADPPDLTVPTDGHGQADVRWLLSAAGADTQVMTARRLDALGNPVDAEVRVTGLRAEPSGGAACLVIRPDTDLAALFEDLSGVTSLVLCLTAGTWQLDRPAVLKRVGSVVLEGAGATATTILAKESTALWFDECGEVHVRDLGLAAQVQDGLGVLTVQRAARVHVERVAARVAGQPAPVSAGILIAGQLRADAPPASRVIVRDCRLDVGDHQTGVRVTDSLRTDISGCEITAVRDAGTGEDLLRWLSNPVFAAAVARRAVHHLPDETEDLFFRTAFSHSIDTLGLHFASEIDDQGGWGNYILDGGRGGSVEELHAAVTDDLVTHNRKSRFFDDRTRFAAWLRGVTADLKSGPAAGVGIEVAGTVAREVRIEDNTIAGAIQGVMVALDQDGDNRTAVERLWIRGNTVAPPARAATAFVQQGFDIGHCGRFEASANVVVQPFLRKLIGYPVEGLRHTGQPDTHAVVAGNTFDGVAVGIHLLGGGKGGVFLRVARDNLCTTGPVLVDPVGTWRDEGNLGV